MGLIRANLEKLDPRFFLYFYISPYYQKFLRSRTINGATVDRLAIKEFPNFPIPLPSLHEQQSIADILGALDDKIDCNRRMNETLEAMARTVFKDWFVDFGPARAKMEGRAPYLVQEIWDLFPDTLDDEGKPAGWDKKQVSDVIELNPSEKLKKGEPAPYLDMAALPTQGASSSAPIDREFTSGTKFRNGDTLLARITPCLENGKTTFVQCLDGNSTGWGSTEFIVMRSIYPVPKPYSYILARDQDFRRHAIQSMTGTSGRQRATTDAIVAYPVTTPDVEGVWLALGALIDPMFQKIAANADESRTLAQTRDLLLPKLMSGEIRIKDVEKAVETIL
jgi:type I restriction enzyme S subunit